MANNEDILEALRYSIGLVSLNYICRLYIKLSNIPSMILSPTTRTELIKEAVNNRYNHSHSIEDIIMVTNMIDMNKDIINRILLLSDFDKNFITFDINHIKIDLLNDLILLPFTDICIDCYKSLTSYRYRSIHILDSFKIIHAIAVTAECKKCLLFYNHSSWYSLKSRNRKINHSSMNGPFKVFYLSDSIAFTYSILFDYTCQLLHDQCPFQSFARILIDRYNYEQQNNGVTFQVIQLSKLFQCHWLLYQIVRFEFMMGSTQIVNLPASLNRHELSHYFESCSGWWYHMFVTFWSRHKSIPNIKCSTSNCSRCVIVDGHQKNRRLVCGFKNVVDTTIDEMTAIEIGCPYTPCRRKQSYNSGIFINYNISNCLRKQVILIDELVLVDPLFCRYHQPSLGLTPSPNLQIAGDIAVAFSVIIIF